MLKQIDDEYGYGEFTFIFYDALGKEHDLSIRFNQDFLMYCLYLDCSEDVHGYESEDFDLFIEPIMNLLEILPYIDNYDHSISLIISDLFEEHAYVLKQLSSYFPLAFEDDDEVKYYYIKKGEY